MKCSEECPAFWMQGGGGYEYPDEVDCYGCMIYGMYRGDDEDRCRLTRAQIDRKLEELEAYEKGEIERPKWVAMRFIHDMDISGDIDLPSFPPKRCISEQVKDDIFGDCVCVKNYKSIYGEVDVSWERQIEYERGYRDAENGKKQDYWNHEEED